MDGKRMLLPIGLAFMLLGTVQVVVEGPSMGPWWTVVGIAHVLFGVVMNSSDSDIDADGFELDD